MLQRQTQERGTVYDGFYIYEYDANSEVLKNLKAERKS